MGKRVIDKMKTEVKDINWLTLFFLCANINIKIKR